MDPFDEFSAPEAISVPEAIQDSAPHMRDDASDTSHGALQQWHFAREEDAFPRSNQRRWEQELPRWLATLNPGRTGYEYEKALRYFFDTPGVPQQLTEISFDLLLAYRGALALRAASRDRPQSARGMHGASMAFDAQLASPWTAALPPHDAETTSEHEGSKREKSPSGGLLAPATVNIRLTALRQFLVHCALFDLLPTLTPDRIRAALRRLSIERRRPYQVLAEAEWGAFLQAALEPANAAHRAARQTSETQPNRNASQARQGPWGLSRAERAELRQRSDEAAREAPATEEHGSALRTETPKLLVSRSRAGLTGARTAQRDHALLSLALATGLRAIELVSLDVGDLVREWHEGREEWWLVLPDAKTKGQRGGRTLPLAPTLVETLLAYVQSTGRRWEQVSDRKTPLFLSGRTFLSATTEAAGPANDRRWRLTVRQVERIVDRVEGQWTSNEEASTHGTVISPHSLRHSTAVALLEGDAQRGRMPASVEHVRGWLGHFDIRTTQGYLAHLEARRQRRPLAISLSETATKETASSQAFHTDQLHTDQLHTDQEATE